MVWVELHENEASRATELKRFHEATQPYVNSLMSGPSFLMEDDISGSSLDGRDANRLKNS